MNGVLELIFQSTKDFHSCFDNYPPDLKGQAYAFNEEVKEFIKAIDENNQENIIEEALDVIVTITSIFMAKEIDYSKIVSSANRVAVKNRTKNDTTHIKDYATGKIRRKKPEEIIADGAYYAIVPITDYDKSEQKENNKPEFAMTNDGKHTLALVFNNTNMANNTYPNNVYVACLKFYKGGTISDCRLVHARNILINEEIIKELKIKWSINGNG